MRWYKAVPAVFKERGFRFHFYSDEGDPREPWHIHVKKDDADAKLWLYPDVTFAYNHGFDARMQRWIATIVQERREEIRTLGMSISPRAVKVSFDEDQMWVRLDDGRTLGIPLAWYPRLLGGSPANREAVEISPSGLHWDALDEDISIAGLIAGRGDMTRTVRHAA